MTAREVLDGIKGQLGAASPIHDSGFIASAPSTVARLTEALESALDACDRIIDNTDGHKPPGPPHPTREQATACRIRAAIENALEGE